MGMKIPDTFMPLTGFICPVEFWPALGYRGVARYIAIYWEPGGDEAAYHDGRTGLVGANWQAYKLLFDANLPPDSSSGLAARAVTGSSELSPMCWVVIDSLTEWAWLAPVDDAELFLRLQWQQNRFLAWIFPFAPSVEQLRTNLDLDAFFWEQYQVHKAFIDEIHRRFGLPVPVGGVFTL